MVKFKVCLERYIVRNKPKSCILTGRFMTLFPGYFPERGTHQGPSGKILIAPAQPCREPCE